MNDDDLKRLELIRDYLTEMMSDPTDTDCMRFALRRAEEYLKGMPKPRKH